MDATHYRRVFLNSQDDGGTAFIEAAVQAVDDDAFLAELKIADCNRIVTLDFFTSDDNITAIRHKARLLLTTVKNFVRAVEANCDEIEGT